MFMGFSVHGFMVYGPMGVGGGGGGVSKGC